MSFMLAKRPLLYYFIPSMDVPQRPIAWYENRALKAARREARQPTVNTDEVRKHLAIAWQAHMQLTQLTPQALQELATCYRQGDELLADPSNETYKTMVRRIGLVASALDVLKGIPDSNRLFLFRDPEDGYTLRHIQSREAWERAHPHEPALFSPFGLEYTEDHLVVAIQRTRELASLNCTADPDSIPIARIPLPWRLGNPEDISNPSPEFWGGTLTVGRQAIMNWTKKAQQETPDAIFAKQIRELPKTAWPPITHEQR